MFPSHLHIDDLEKQTQKTLMTLESVIDAQ